MLILRQEHDVAVRGVGIDEIFSSTNVICRIMNLHDVVSVEAIVLENHMIYFISSVRLEEARVVVWCAKCHFKPGEKMQAKFEIKILLAIS